VAGPASRWTVAAWLARPGKSNDTGLARVLGANSVQFDGSLAELYGIFRRFFDICRTRLAVIQPSSDAVATPRHFETSRTEEVHVADLVDIALPAAAQATAEGFGLVVQRSVTSGARVRDIRRDEAELAIEYLREWGFTARIVEHTPGDEPGAARAA
jgi:hypothetical protein